MSQLTLTQMGLGKTARVVEIHGGQGMVRRLDFMGMRRGTKVRKISGFALRGPVTIRVGRGVVALGYGMASRIIVELLTDEDKPR